MASREKGMAVLLSDITGSEIKKATRDKDEHFITIKETIHQEDNTLLYMHPTWEHQLI